MRCLWLTVTFFLAWALPLATFATANSAQELTAATHSKPNLDRGADLFQGCAVCHGIHGEGSRDGWVPRVGGQHFSVLVKQLVDYRHDQRWDLRMQQFSDRHRLINAQAIADVAGYLSQLRTPAAQADGTGELVARGATVYAQSCQSCHRPAGEGDGKRVIPQLAGQHYKYLQRQIYDGVDGRRPNFSVAHIRLFGQLEHDDIVGVSEYLSRIVQLNGSESAVDASGSVAK
jgi:cytochrome c553